MGYKLIASDLDGTLLDYFGKLSEENLMSIRELEHYGVYFVPASGRSLSEIPSILRDEDSIRFYIHSSGAGIFDKKTGENISLGFPFDISKKILDLVFSADCHVTVRLGGRMLTDDKLMNEKSMSEYNVWPPHAELLYSCGEGIDNFKEKMLSSSEIDMISLFFRNWEELYSMRDILSEIEGINVASACDYNVEITYEKAGKGNALIALSQKLDLDISEVISLGDSENDLPMILAAGLGLATENAIQEIKEKANGVICSNNENVVPFVLNKYIK